MICQTCQTCHGNGFTTRVGPVVADMETRVQVNRITPCPACGGCGEQSCCEGEQWSDREREIEQVKK